MRFENAYFPLEGGWSSPFARCQGIHAEDAVAHEVGLGGIIVQGMCLFAIAMQAVIDAAADGDPARVRTASTRFLRPIRPATALRSQVYRTADGARFGARDPDANTVLAGAATTT
jgi:acyl dehydratase